MQSLSVLPDTHSSLLLIIFPREGTSQVWMRWSLPCVFLLFWSPLPSFSWSLIPSSAYDHFHFSVLNNFSSVNKMKYPLTSNSFLHLLKHRLVTITENLDSLCPTVLFQVIKIAQEMCYFCYLPREDSSTCFSLYHFLLPTFPRAGYLE